MPRQHTKPDPSAEQQKSGVGNRKRGRPDAEQHEDDDGKEEKKEVSHKDSGKEEKQQPRRSSRSRGAQHSSSSSSSSSHPARDDDADDASDGKGDDDDDDGGDHADRGHGKVYDAKMDEGVTQMDLKVSKHDPISKRSTSRVQAQAREDRATGDVEGGDEEHINLDRVRLHTPDGELEEVTDLDDHPLPPHSRCVLYWMQREQRVEDSWPLLFARELAQSHGLPLHVVFCMVPTFLDATTRQYHYMIRGMQEVEATLRSHAIPFHVLLGFAPDVLPPFIAEHGVGVVVNDFNPLRCHREWVTRTAHTLHPRGVRVYRVDGHNTVPMWVASDKAEHSARTIRPKIHRHLPTFLREYPRFAPPPNQHDADMPKEVDWKAVDASLTIDRTVPEVTFVQPGEKAALAELHTFLEERLKRFNVDRNDPTTPVLSNMSCYLHYGMISAARVVLQANAYKKRYGDAVSSFIEEIVVRRELSDNFCWHQPHYDSFLAAKDWARDSLNKHKADKREFLYTLGEFECGVTHDDLWNAAQLQLVEVGKMHGFLRMYWAKKLLEWTASPEQAMQFTIHLNDKYELDGRDPNGYVGIAWSILGIHDQGWAERAVFGKVRYMNYAGCKRKFPVAAFVDTYPAAKVGSKGFKVNEGKAKGMDEERARQEGRGRADPSVKTEGTGEGGRARTKREMRVEGEEKERQEEDEAKRADRDTDVGGEEHGAQRGGGARRRVEEQKQSADDRGRTPAAGGKRARREMPH